MRFSARGDLFSSRLWFAFFFCCGFASLRRVFSRRCVYFLEFTPKIKSAKKKRPAEAERKTQQKPDSAANARGQRQTPQSKASPDNASRRQSPPQQKTRGPQASPPSRRHRRRPPSRHRTARTPQPRRHQRRQARTHPPQRTARTATAGQSKTTNRHSQSKHPQKADENTSPAEAKTDARGTRKTATDTKPRRRPRLAKKQPTNAFLFFSTERLRRRACFRLVSVAIMGDPCGVILPTQPPPTNIQRHGWRVIRSWMRSVAK